MEYIEPKPVPVDPKRKQKKIILVSAISLVAATAVALTYYFTISKIFLDYDNIDLFTYSYQYDKNDVGVRIDSVKDDAILPAHFRIPNKLNDKPVVEIADEVFKDRTELESVTFPASLTTIGDECFYGCENLSSFNVPENIQSIGTQAFENTLWLENQEDGEVAVGNMLYTYKGEMDFPAKVVAGEDNTSGNGTVVDLSKYVNMSSGVFKNQKNLVYAEIPSNFTEIYDSTFQDCEQLSEVKLHDGLTKIDDYAFSGCASLENIEIPTSVNHIGSNAFSYSAIKGEITLNSGLDYVGSNAFEYCRNITKVNIPEGFKYISDYLFNGCENLAEVKFDNSEYSADSKVDYIGMNAFNGTKIKTLEVPFNVTSIKQGAFANCPELESIYVYDNLNGTEKNSYVSAYTSEDGEVVEAGWQTGGSYQGIVNFEAGTFTNSPKFNSIILMNETKKTISNLNEVSIPVTLQSLGGSNSESKLFTGTSIETINLSKNIDKIAKEEYKNTINNNYSLKTLPPSIFENALKLKNVNFGNSNIETIGRNAFTNCEALTSITLSNTVRSVETGAFADCHNLANVQLSNNSKTITERMFANCTSLTSIVLPDSFLTINKYGFIGCSNLNNITLSKNLTDIGEGAFSGCTSLQNVIIPNTCKALATQIFKDCTSLTSVTLSTHSNANSVTANMFEGTTSLKEIVLPKNIRSIASKAFANSGLKNITLEYAGVVTLGANAFENVNLEAIYVPEEFVDSYKANASWAQYSSIINKI